MPTDAGSDQAAVSPKPAANARARGTRACARLNRPGRASLRRAATGRRRRGALPRRRQSAAPVDLTGYWVSIVTEDWIERMSPDSPPSGTGRGWPRRLAAEAAAPDPAATTAG